MNGLVPCLTIAVISSNTPLGSPGPQHKIKGTPYPYDFSNTQIGTYSHRARQQWVVCTKQYRITCCYYWSHIYIMLFHTLEQAYMVAFVFRTCWVIISGFPSPPNSDVDYMIFYMHVWSFCMRVHACICMYIWTSVCSLIWRTLFNRVFTEFYSTEISGWVWLLACNSHPSKW